MKLDPRWQFLFRRSRPAVLLGVGCTLLLSLAVGSIFSPAGVIDPDRFYHLALARETAAAGKAFLKEIPQAAGLGWDKSFPEKEFLFHLMNQAAYRLGGESGILLLTSFMSAFALALLAWNMCLFIHPALALAILSGFYFSDAWMMLRLTLLRPHVHALVWFQLILAGLLRGNMPLAVAGLLGYSLAYHTFYVPLVILILFFAFEADWTGSRLRFAVFGTIAILAGIVFNPHFPWNVWMSVRHLLIALFEAGDRTLDFGMELFPWTTDKIFRLHLPSLAALIGIPFAALIGVRIPSYRLLFRSTPLSWLWVTTALFFALSAQNPRALEYAVPLICLTLAVAVQFIRERELLPWRAWGLLAVVAILAVPRMLDALPYLLEPPPVGEGLQKLRAGIALIPERDAVVFNAEWDTSPYIYHSRPDLKWIDLLDPSFLHARDPALHDLRWNLRQGTVGDPWGVLRSRTGSVAVVTRNPGLSRQLRGDPHFERIFPDAAFGFAAAGERGDEVIRMRTDRDPHFVLDWQGAEVFAGRDTGRIAALEPSKYGTRLRSLRTEFETFVLGEKPGDEKRDSEGKPLERERLVSAMLDLSAEWRKARGGSGPASKPPVRTSSSVGRNPWEALNASSIESGEKRVEASSLEGEENPAQELTGKGLKADGSIGCFLVRPASGERHRQKGRTVVALGGARNLRLWINGRKVFNSVVARTGANLIGHLVLLDQPLRESDRVEVIACSSMPEVQLSVAMSFWSPQELREVCLRKGWTPPENGAPIEGWPNLGQYSETCFGAYARKPGFKTTRMEDPVLPENSSDDASEAPR